MAPIPASTLAHLIVRQSYSGSNGPDLGPPPGAIAGIVVGVICAVVFIFALVRGIANRDRSQPQPQPLYIPHTEHGFSHNQSPINNTANNQSIELEPQPTQPPPSTSHDGLSPPTYKSVATGDRRSGRHISGHHMASSGVTFMAANAGADAGAATAAAGATAGASGGGF